MKEFTNIRLQVLYHDRGGNGDDHLFGQGLYMKGVGKLCLTWLFDEYRIKD